MAIDLLFGFVAVVVIVLVVSTRGRQQKATTKSRAHVLQTVAPIVGGTLSEGMQLTGTYQRHPVETSLRTTGRVDTTGSGHSSASTIEVLLLVVHGVSGMNPWSFFTSVSLGGRLEDKWRSAIAFVGVFGKLFSQMSPIPIDRAVEGRLRQGGMLEALERLVPREGRAPYVFVSFYPDGAPAIAKTLQRVEALGAQLAERARHEAAERLERGGQLRIEVERGSDDDPTPERFRELLDAAIAVAELNASINQ